MRRELFGDGLAFPSHEPTTQERVTALRLRAADLRHYADGGMRPRVHRRLAEQYEQEADALEQTMSEPARATTKGD